jgi:hydroxyacylglutathione hydrolase
MLQEKRAGAVTQIMMGREIDGAVYYWTAAYLVDDLLIDTGCFYTAPELMAYLQDQEISQVVNTHHHEDHIGGNALLQKLRSRHSPGKAQWPPLREATTRFKT